MPPDSPRPTARLARVAGAAAIAAWLAGRVMSDRFAWSQFLAWIPAPLAAAAVVAALVLDRPAPRWRSIAWAAASAAILLDFAVIRHRLLAGPAQTPGALRLVNGNVHLIGPRAQRIYPASLRALDGDVTVVSTAFPPGEVHLLSDAMEGLGQRVVVWPFVLASKLPILEARPLVERDDVHVAVLRIDTTASLGRPLTIYAVDLPSSPWIGRHAVAERARQLIDSVPAEPPDVVVGDFNMTRGGAALASLFPGLEHAWDQAGRGLGASFPRTLPVYHIDHCLLAPWLAATSYELADPGIGRHLFQVVEVQEK